VKADLDGVEWETSEPNGCSEMYLWSYWFSIVQNAVLFTVMTWSTSKQITWDRISINSVVHDDSTT
jgi:hypothetical protein